jgi:hypothetical protein
MKDESAHLVSLSVLHIVIYLCCFHRNKLPRVGQNLRLSADRAPCLQVLKVLLLSWRLEERF